MLEIEIIETNLIEGGIQVLARAWEDGKQLGFGADGTVDIERFRFINPPLLVPDQNGTIEVVIPANKEFGTEEIITKYREDPEEAILQALERAIHLTKKDGSNIIKGKIGHTTDIIYAESGDGWVGNTNANWTTSRDATTGNTANDSATVAYVISDNDGGKRIFRVFLAFDTSGLGAGASISSADLDIVVSGGGGVGSRVVGQCLVSASQASAAALVNADYDQIGATELATRYDPSTAYTTDTYSLNPSGISNIDPVGFTKMALRTDYDFDDIDPSGGPWFNIVKTTEATAGTTDDPYMTITYTAGGGPIFIPKVITY